MWINKHAHRAWVEQVKNREHFLADLQRHIEKQRLTIAADQHDLAALRDQVLKLTAQIGSYKAVSAAHKAYGDLWRVQVNHLQQQVADLLSRQIPGYKVPTPVIESDKELLPPGYDFEDMGDAAWEQMGYADAHPVSAAGTPRIPVDDLDSPEVMAPDTSLTDPLEGQ